MILQELSKQDAKWRSIALNITKGNKFEADEITQQMYLKLMNYDRINDYIAKGILDFIVTRALKHIYLDSFKGVKNTSISLLYYLEDTQKEYLHNDEQQELIDRANKLPWHQKELLKESYDRSNRQIAKEYNLNYGLVHREIHSALKTVLGDRYNEYKNSNLKYKR